MSGPAGSQHWMYASGGFYPFSIEQSLKYSSADTLEMKRTPSSAGNRQTWSVSIWLKRGQLGVSQQQLLEAGSSGGYSSRLFWYFDSNDKLVLSDGNTNYGGGNQVFRDVGAWYHILIRCTGGSVTHYVNGLLDKTQALSGDTAINSTVQHGFGTRGGSGAGDEFDGYLAQYALFDGTAYTYDQVTETINGILVPKDLSALSYGTNGFLLDFADDSAVGTDAVGSNDMDTVSGFAAYMVVPDSPTNNFATINPLDQEQQGSTKNVTIRGNLDVKSQGNTGYGKTRATFAIPTSGKWYWEMRCTNTIGQAVGILNASEDLDNTNHFDGYAEGYSYRSDGQKKNNGTASSYGDSWTNLDNIGVLVDADAGEIFFYKNGTIQNSGTAAFTGLDMTNNYMPIWADRSTSGNGRAIFNFGQDSTFYNSETAGGNSDANGNGDFQYTVPTGALALCSANLPELDIGPNSSTQADDYFNTVLYTGDGTSSNAITGVGFQPDFTWIKTRNGTASHALFDSVRGADNVLRSNGNDAENASAISTADFGGLTSFDTDGFTVDDGTSTSFDATNGSGDTYASWNWKAGGTAVSNTSGSITSSVSANTDAGFSIVSFTGTGANATVGHGLSSAPEMIILKNRIDTVNWLVGSTYNPNGWQNYLNLNGTTSALSASTIWQDTAPTSSVFSLGNNSATNGSGDATIAYCFHSSDVCKVGKYVGNNNGDGAFVYTGFRPAWVMIKNTADVTHWAIWDSKRVAYNVNDTALYPSSGDADQTGTSLYVDFVSNGFKWRASHNSVNGGGDTFIYLAFAEAPFKYANAR